MDNLLSAFSAITQKRKEQMSVLKELKLEEKKITDQIMQWMIEKNCKECQLDDGTMIILRNEEKKILKPKKAYEHHVMEILEGYGVDEQSIKDLLSKDKIDDVVHLNKLKIMKKK